MPWRFSCSWSAIISVHADSIAVFAIKMTTCVAVFCCIPCVSLLRSPAPLSLGRACASRLARGAVACRRNGRADACLEGRNAGLPPCFPGICVGFFILVCVCMCVFVCPCVYVYPCIIMSKRLCVATCLYHCLCLCMCAFWYVCVIVCICMRVYVHVCLSAWVCVWVCASSCVCFCTYACVYWHLCVWTCVWQTREPLPRGDRAKIFADKLRTFCTFVIEQKILSDDSWLFRYTKRIFFVRLHTVVLRPHTKSYIPNSSHTAQACDRWWCIHGRRGVSFDQT